MPINARNTPPVQRPIPQLPQGKPFKVGLMSDGHEGYAQIAEAIRRLNREHVVATFDLGDASEQGQAIEYDHYIKAIAGSDAPVRVLPGNHDQPVSHHVPLVHGTETEVANSGPDRGVGRAFLERFGMQPGSYDLGSVHLTTLDNSRGSLGREQMAFLARDLAAHPGEAKVVLLHEPPFFSRVPRYQQWLNRKLPAIFANVTMNDPAELARFHRLMVQHGVQQVVAGHTHQGWETVKDGVTYTVVRATGGKLLHPGDRHGYGVLEFDGKRVRVRQEAISEPGGKLGWAMGNLRYFLRERKLLKQPLPPLIPLNFRGIMPEGERLAARPERLPHL